MGSIASKLKNKKYSVTQWQTQSGNLTNSHKAKIYLRQPDLAQQKLRSRIIRWMTPLE